MWQLMFVLMIPGCRLPVNRFTRSASKDPELEATYLRLLKESSTHEKAITRDLGRTFPHHSVFTDSQGIGQENLFNVLKAYSLYVARLRHMLVTFTSSRQIRRASWLLPRASICRRHPLAKRSLSDSEGIRSLTRTTADA
jgi:hypothetical protein